MELIIAFLLGMFVGGTAGLFLMALAVMAKRADESGEADAEAAVGFLLLVALIWLGLWALSGWTLP